MLRLGENRAGSGGQMVLEFQAFEVRSGSAEECGRLMRVDAVTLAKIVKEAKIDAHG